MEKGLEDFFWSSIDELEIKPEHWIFGGFYKDKKENYWCCVGVATSHGAPYRMIRAFHGNGHNATYPVQAWAEESGALTVDFHETKIISGPHPHPWENLFSGVESEEEEK